LGQGGEQGILKELEVLEHLRAALKNGAAEALEVGWVDLTQFCESQQDGEHVVDVVPCIAELVAQALE